MTLEVISRLFNLSIWSIVTLSLLVELPEAMRLCSYILATFMLACHITEWHIFSETISRRLKQPLSGFLLITFFGISYAHRLELKPEPSLLK